jgi:hypothetical protein
LIYGKIDKEIAGVRNAGRARVGHECQVFPFEHARDEDRRLLFLVVVVVARELCLYGVPVEQVSVVARVLGGDEVDFIQHADRPEGDVLEVPMGWRLCRECLA